MAFALIPLRPASAQDARDAVSATDHHGAATLAAGDSALSRIHRSRWDYQAVPFVRSLSPRVVGSHVWAGGLSIGAGRPITRRFDLDAALLFGAAPQLNYRGSAVLNLASLATSAEFHPKRESRWDPYGALGLAFERLRYPDAPLPYASSRTHGSVRTAVGVRYAITPRVTWRAEGATYSGVGTSSALSAGIAFRTGDR